MLRAWQWRDDYRLPAIAAAAVLVAVLPLAFLAAVLPTRYSLLLVGTVAFPLGVVVGLRLSLGSLLAVAIVSPPLLQFIVQGSPEGIPPAAVAPYSLSRRSSSSVAPTICITRRTYHSSRWRSSRRSRTRL